MPAIADLLPQDRVSPIAAVGTDTSAMGSARGCLKGAGLLWSVKKVPLSNPVTAKVVPGFFAVVREDNDEVVGVVEGQYKPVQNEDFFCDIADQFVHDGAKITHCAYVHRNLDILDRQGNVIAITPAEVGGMIYMHLSWDIRRTALDIVGDVVGRTATIRTSHDGKTAALIRLSLLRLKCLNGMVVPCPGMGFEFRIPHTESASERIKSAQRVLAKAPEYYRKAGQALNLLARKSISESTAKRLTALTIDKKNVDTPSQMTKADAQKAATVMERFKGQQPGGFDEALKGTAYGWINAVFELADYGMRIKKSSGFSEEQQRFKSSFSGVGYNLKLAAWEAIQTELGFDAEFTGLTM